MSLHDIIDAVSRVTGVTAVAVVDYEGIPIESRATLGQGENERLCAWAAELGRVAVDTVAEWEGGPLQVTMFEASMGSLMLADVGRGYLVIAGDPALNAGMLRLEVDRAAEILRQFLGAGLGSRDAEGRATA
jgi:predicted regulator of Ras-like GTPase activity (Roadblock/LC7/MglB family)